MAKYLITGITGQDGSYMSELLLEKGHEVHGIIRRASTLSTERLEHLLYPEEKIKLHYGDLNEGVENLIYDIKPEFIINLGAQSHVKVSFDQPVYTVETNALGPLRILEAIRRVDKNIRFYQASSSEMFGLTPPGNLGQDESTQMNPSSPYGAAKLAAFHITRQYRMGYGLFASTGILMNHESPRRGKTFVTQKVVRAAVRIKHGLQKEVVLGNLDAKRDWGHSKDYMEAIYKIINHSIPDEFVVATGEHYSVKEFVIKAFQLLDLDWNDYVKYDPKYLRPVEVPDLRGNPAKIKYVLKWEPKITFTELIQEMIDAAIKEEIPSIGA